MKFVTISDTHGLHGQLQLPKGDVLIHAGDVSNYGSKSQVIEFLEWFANLDFNHKIFIAGNHDYFFEKNDASIVNELIPTNVIYLNDSGVEIAGFKIWGSPIQPWFFDWAFNRKRGNEIKKHWDLIPNDLDILITHGPPYGILDKTVRNDIVGCEDLLETVMKQKPKVHIFGHIHEDYGITIRNDIRFINASVLNHWYLMVNEPIVFEL